MRYYLSPHIFFKAENGEVLLWNYLKHEQFVITDEYFAKIMQVDRGDDLSACEIIQTLEENRIIQKEPYPNEDWGLDDISYIFHVGTSDIETVAEEFSGNDIDTVARDYIEQCSHLGQLPPKFLDLDGPLTALPKANPELLSQKSYLDVLMSRKTCREFLSKPISLEQLSTLLFYSLGQMHDTDQVWPEFKALGLKDTATHKTSPSGGGRHPEEAYVAVFRVDRLSPGIYHYRPQDHSLCLVREGDFEQDVIAINENQAYSAGLAAGIFLTACLERTWWKYQHSRIYRVILLETGHLSQTILLNATALDLDTWICGAFKDSQLANLLKLERRSHAPLFFIGLGKSSGNAMPPSMKKVISDRLERK